MRTIIMSFVCLMACGDNITTSTPDARRVRAIDPGDLILEELAADAQVHAPDAPQDLSEDAKAGCCHALSTGATPNQECGYPPGLCRNGKKTLFCGESAYEMCSP